MDRASVSTGDDRRWMAQALALAAIAEGTTNPNPRVGCVLVREGRVVGRGFHRAPGQPHAEVVAIADAGDLARGATLYVNLEPCAHHGRTPPCIELLMRSGVRRVVAAMRDPNPLVDGRGFQQLREAGIAVDVGLMAEEAERLNDPFLHWYRRSRPLVTLKAAISLDGMLSADRGHSQWITGPAARRFAHRLRLRADAILVGAGTVRADDPRLTVRLAGVTRTPLRVVLSAGLDLDPRARIFDADPSGAAPRCVVYTTSAGGASAAQRRLSGKAEVVTVGETQDGGIDLRGVLQNLAERSVQSVLVEGGGATFASFLAQGLADRGALFCSSRLLGARGATPLVDGPSVASPSLAARMRDKQVLSFGEDWAVLGRIGGETEESETCSPD